MDIYGGKVLLCKAGIETPHIDAAGNQLFTGDIVIVFADDYTPDGLTVVVSDSWCNADDPVYYAMGIKDSMQQADNDGWKVLRVKSYADVVDKEHWPAYGFSFQGTTP